jgi:hypothetical protein
MTRETSASMPSIAIAHRLLLQANPRGSDDHALLAAALQLACSRVVASLRDSLGDDGCDAVLGRALGRAEAEHPALRRLHRRQGDTIQLDGVASTIDEFGASDATAALEALFAALMDDLGRLIGHELAVGLIDGGSRYSRDGAKELGQSMRPLSRQSPLS